MKMKNWEERKSKGKNGKGERGNKGGKQRTKRDKQKWNKQERINMLDSFEIKWEAHVCAQRIKWKREESESYAVFFDWEGERSTIIWRA